MISVEIKINGCVVALINAKRVLDGLTGRATYQWTSAQFPMNLEGAPVAGKGVVQHDAKDGAVQLARLLCAAHVGIEGRK